MTQPVVAQAILSMVAPVMLKFCPFGLIRFSYNHACINNIDKVLVVMKHAYLVLFGLKQSGLDVTYPKCLRVRKNMQK